MAIPRRPNVCLGKINIRKNITSFVALYRLCVLPLSKTWTRPLLSRQYSNATIIAPHCG